jgi:hypothetical protein
MKIQRKPHMFSGTTIKGLFCAMLAGIICFTVGCKKFIDVNAPGTSLTNTNVYSTDATAVAVVTGIYTNIMVQNFPGIEVNATSVYCGLSADELTYFSAASRPSLQAYYTNSLTNSVGTDLWSIYSTVYTANAAIQGINASQSLTPAIKQQLLGEAYFMRAFCYFYLTNLFGNVPLVLSTDYQTNSSLPNTAQTTIYTQIISDLKNAQSLLSSQYLDGTLLSVSSDRARPTKWAATALLARTYLFYGNLTGNQSDFNNAIIQSDTLINNTGLFGLSTLNNAFLRSSLGNNEAIWQLQPVNAQVNTPDGSFFILPASGPSGSYPVYLNNSLLNSFEPGDQRKVDWISSVTDTINGSATTYYFNFKYKSSVITTQLTEYEMVLRLGEIYLIRGEAEANVGSTSAAEADINTIRNRAGLPNYAGAADENSLLTAFLAERQHELFTEWGHRWLDLKRTKNIDVVMGVVSAQNGGIWASYKQLYPIPLGDIQSDYNLKQNQGY